MKLLIILIMVIFIVVEASRSGSGYSRSSGAASSYSGGGYRRRSWDQTTPTSTTTHPEDPIPKVKPRRSCNGDVHGIPCCDDGFILGDNDNGAQDVFIQPDEYKSSCLDSCKSLHSGSIGMTESVKEKYSYGNGKNKNKCWCEFGNVTLDAPNQNYQTCVFTVPGAEELKRASGESVWVSEDVDGLLGYGRTFDKSTLRRFGGTVQFNLTPQKCCDECNDWGRGESGVDFIKLMGDMRCTCFKKNEGVRPVTKPGGYVSGVCGDLDIEVQSNNKQGLFGQGWWIYGGYNPTAVDLGRTDFGLQPTDCCEECAKKNVTEMFTWDDDLRGSCRCFVRIPGMIPETGNTPVMVDACG